jgi:hypothetical protein
MAENVKYTANLCRIICLHGSKKFEKIKIKIGILGAGLEINLHEF